MNPIGNTFGSIVEFVIALGILITLHELGHFIVAKLFKIPVDEFGLGFPPRLVRLFSIGETEFTLNWIPFGAFVRPRGENDPEVPGGMASASPLKRLAVLLGGPGVNILTGILLYGLLFSLVGAPVNLVKIDMINENSPAAQSGMLAGDIILKLDGEDITNSQQLAALVKSKAGQEITLTIQRDGKVMELKATPRVNPPEGQGALGIRMAAPLVRKVSFWESIPIASQTIWDQVVQLVTLPANIARGTITADQARPVGPVGMFDIYNQVRERDVQSAEEQPNTTGSGIVNRLWLLAFISAALGITNLLPIPALDGGRILFVLPEILLRRRIPAKYENIVHLVGFAALLILMVYITTQDISHRIVLPQ